MPDFHTEPVTFRKAVAFLDKPALPLPLTTAEIAEKVGEETRGRAFFSATITKLSVLDKLKAVCTSIAEGKLNEARGREILRDFLGKQGMGYTAPGSPEDRDIRRIESTARLNLIMRQNVAMAHAVGQREVAESDAVMEILPNYKYIATIDNETRDTHAELNGLVLPKDDPFWDTHYPPWEFNCRCFVIDTDEPVNGRATITDRNTGGGDRVKLNIRGGDMEIEPNESGFVFHSRPGALDEEPDESGIVDPELRGIFAAQWKEWRERRAQNS